MFDGNAGITFNPIKTGATPTIITGETNSPEGCASISDSEGNLLFYTNGETVFTKNNTVMLNGTGLSSSGTSTQSSIIVPQPETQKYYVFTTDYNNNPNGFEYSIVNMELEDGEGSVETKNVKLIASSMTEKVTACSHSTEDAYWVITHTSGDSKYYSYKLSNTSLSGPVISDTGSTHNTARGYMKTSIDGSKIVSLLYDEDKIDVGDFNAEDGTISNILTLTGVTYDVGPYGLEFSSDSSKFYVSDGAGEKLYQFDLTYDNARDMVINMIELPSISGASLGALQMGADEKIYIPETKIGQPVPEAESFPEDLIFDEAIKSGEIEKKKDFLKEIEKKKEAYKEKLKDLEDDAEIEKVKSYINRIDALKEKIEKNIDELNNNNKT